MRCNPCRAALSASSERDEGRDAGVSVYFLASVLVLGIMLSVPVTRMIWTLSVRRIQFRENRTLNEEELQGQRNRARVIAVVLSMGFSYLFNLYLGGILGYA